MSRNSGNQLRTSLIAMSLVSISQVNIGRILMMSIDQMETGYLLANQLLQTIQNRLAQYSLGSDAHIPCIYRDTLVEYMSPILK